MGGPELSIDPLTLDQLAQLTDESFAALAGTIGNMRSEASRVWDQPSGRSGCPGDETPTG
ncbi:hypothetical protein GCM10012289_69040 [Nonomuraea cavernae]|uniref:Uncharacterized protein n=1 Tax=Nonomuraea cavernae TaxID=2045107 RepID=A0A917ZFR7_9ACTN|nr:hypothetical protein GCM10012289_69040 [Nonomuraea cavernae]